MLLPVDAARDYIRSYAGSEPFDLAVILGSGLGALVDDFPCGEGIAYARIPGFPRADVPGHAGKLFWSSCAGRRILFFQGRFHLYQGLGASELVAPVLLAHALGCAHLLLTNASGAVNPAYHPGDLVFVTDHLNLSGENPLRGISPPPFIDVSRLYGTGRLDALRRYLQAKGVRLHHGVLASLPGPSYETPAEVRMLGVLGADLVSMSTVHEALAACYLGMQVTAVSVVANPAAGIGDSPLDHLDVLHVVGSSVGAVRSLLDYLLENLDS